jgi:hypothetical protein
MFTVCYKKLWTAPLSTPEMKQANDQLWFISLKDFTPEIILKTGEQIIKIFKYPPSIAEFIEHANALQRNEKFERENIEREKCRLNAKEPDRELAKHYLAQIRSKLNLLQKP